jgi:cystathionine beta-lyase/cystathionine gamma-synthase
LNSITQRFDHVRNILDNLPPGWVELTTHRLDIYNEDQAKSQFLDALNTQLSQGNPSAQSLESLPTAYDYIRLGHQLSSVLEWLIAAINQLPAEQVITFSSRTMPILAVVRMNTLLGKPTTIYYQGEDAPLTDLARLSQVYGYQFDLQKVGSSAAITEPGDGTNIWITQSSYHEPLTLNANIDVTVNLHPHYGSALLVHDTPRNQAASIKRIVKEVQHVRRRETIAITPVNALHLLQAMVNQQTAKPEVCEPTALDKIIASIKDNTGTTLTPLIGSSGLSIQYAIMMGLVENAMTAHPGKPIRIILPPNCYGGTNDQCRRIADLIPSVEIVDLLVDGEQNLVSSLNDALNTLAEIDGVPIVLAEIPTNPRVEVPDMDKLQAVLSEKRKAPAGRLAIEPVFIVDQTFCPNVKLLHDKSQLAQVKIVSFSSGSKFPSGGRCIAGYCAVNGAASDLLDLIAKHLSLSDNHAIAHQLNTLADNMPTMPARIQKAYANTRSFVDHVRSALPSAKINFVSNELAAQGFTPSVFSLDLPTVGQTSAEREAYKRALNLKLINHMISVYPEECKYCVSYGQLKGSYWTIPATSTQGTTKEHDKDYIVRVALSPDTDVAKLSKVFSDFCHAENLR